MGRLMTPQKKEKVFKRINSDHPFANCRPRGDRVVVQRDSVKQESKGGILLANAHNKRVPLGTVVRVGPGKKNSKGEIIPIDLKEGDRVILTNYAGLDISDPGMTRSEESEFVMLREEDVVAFQED